MALGRLIRAFDAEHLASIRPKRLTAIFVVNDIFCFITQIVGAGVQVTGDARIIDIGRKAVVAGLIFALVVFCGFVLVSVVFHRRLGRSPTPVVARNPDLVWKRYMWALYVSCFALMVRNLVRTIEFGAMEKSALNTKEVYIYIFDAAMMLISMAVFVIWHPGRLIKRARKAKRSSGLIEPAPRDSDSANVLLTECERYRVR